MMGMAEAGEKTGLSRTRAAEDEFRTALESRHELDTQCRGFS